FPGRCRSGVLAAEVSYPRCHAAVVPRRLPLAQDIVDAMAALAPLRSARIRDLVVPVLQELFRARFRSGWTTLPYAAHDLRSDANASSSGPRKAVEPRRRDARRRDRVSVEAAPSGGGWR